MLAAGLARFGTGFHRLVLAGLTDSVEFERGGFWRRALALLADAIIVTVILQLLAFALYPLSNGRVQFVSGVAMLHCDKLDAVPKGVTVPADFDATSITDCRHTLFGLTSARIVTVARATQNGAITTTKFISHSLDAQGKPIVGPTLDGLIWILLLAMRSAFDRGSRGTPARRLCRVRLSNAADGQSPPPAPTVTRRYAVLTLPLLPLLIWSLMLQPIMCAEAVASIWLTLGMILPAVVLLGAVGLAVVAIIQRRDTWYDRFAGTSVLALDRDHAIIPAVVTPPPLQPESGPALPALPEPAMADAAGAEFAPQALPPPLPKPPSANYLVRHWRGELSLPKSYWLNGFLGGLAIGVAIVALNLAIRRDGDAQPMLWLVSLISIWIIVLLFTAWQAVGIWRSATNYRFAGNRFWGGAAKTLTVLGLLSTGYNGLFVGAPQIAGIYDIVAGDALVGPHQFRVVGNGQVLEFSGGISFGVARELANFLGAMANVKTVQLNSLGGRILEAQKMSDMIRARGLSTYVVQNCLSACTIVFLGGKERFLFETAKLGFHQPTFRGMTAGNRRTMIANEEARLQRLGLSAAFAVRANAATPSSMWYPDKDELLREKVVTRIIAPQPPKPAPPAWPQANAASPPASSVPAQDPAFPTPGTVQIGGGTYETRSVQLPADLVKRLATSRPKPPPAAASGTAAATGDQQ
jgi:hypothetical protein